MMLEWVPGNKEVNNLSGDSRTSPSWIRRASSAFLEQMAGDVAQAWPSEGAWFCLFVCLFLAIWEGQTVANSCCAFDSLNILQRDHIYLGNQGPPGGLLAGSLAARGVCAMKSRQSRNDF